MWCPKCKNEYVAGITRCADCDCDLVESLDETFEEDVNLTDSSFISKEAVKSLIESEVLSKTDASDDADEPMEAPQSISPAHAYVSKSAKKEDVKSTAYTFLIVSIGGFILMGLIFAGVLPIHLAGYMKIIMGIVMGAMFLTFFIVGIRSFRDIKVLESEASDEEKQFEEITEWFRKNHTAASIDEQIDTSVSKEQRYFSRYEVMSHLISEKYENLEESFLDHMIEELYTELFAE